MPHDQALRKKQKRAPEWRDVFWAPKAGPEPSADASLTGRFTWPFFDPRQRGPNARRELSRVLTALCVGEEMKAAIGSAPEAITAAASGAGLKLSPAQVKHYFDGVNTPSRNVVIRLATKLEVENLRLVSEWPWKLLTPRHLTLRDIETICAPSYNTAFRLPNDLPASFNRRERSRWHENKSFSVDGEFLYKPGAPEQFWLQVARLRAALELKDYEAFNAHFIAVIKNLPSIAEHRAVWPHVPMLLTCVGMLFELVDRHYRWFRVDWQIVLLYLAFQTYESRLQGMAKSVWTKEVRRQRPFWESTLSIQTFVDVFDGNESGVGSEYELPGRNHFHPANFSTARGSKLRGAS